MRENDEITGLFRSRLAGAEMTVREDLSLIHISEPTRQRGRSRMPSSA